MDKWTVDDVQEWLKYLRNVDGKRMSDLFGECFGENAVNGKILSTLNDQTLQEMGIRSINKRKKLLFEVKKILSSPNKTYDLREHLVISKLEKSSPNWLIFYSKLIEELQYLYY